MALNVGEVITAKQVEFLTGPWPGEVFTALCDALAWVESGGRWGPMPAFTGRINVTDLGVDASWEDVRLEASSDSSVPTPMLGAGWNVLQYKQRDLAARDRSRIVSDLKSKLKGALKEIADRHGRWPDRYVLFVNVDLTAQQKEILQQAIRVDAAERADIGIEIVDAGNLAALLNNQPHLRAAFFGDRAFLTWRRAMDDHKARNLARLQTPMVGRTARSLNLCVTLSMGRDLAW